MDFCGYPTAILENGRIRIEYLLRGGLRLARLFYGTDGHNLLAELPDIGWQAPHGYYRVLGGHRMWTAPEIAEVTYNPEPPELSVERTELGVRLTQPADPWNGLQKTMQIDLEPETARFTLRHFLTNDSQEEKFIAPWAITQLPLGGRVILPQPLTRPAEGGLLPNRSLVFWPYTRLDDPRIQLKDEYILVDAFPMPTPCKIGWQHPLGCCAYEREGVIILKQVAVQSYACYPDMNSVFEVYCNDRLVEVESLGPLTELQPGESVSHVETWTLLETNGIGIGEYLPKLLKKYCE